MKLHVVMAQRVCRYDGEYAPEALAVMSECDYDENPEDIWKKVEKARATNEFDSVVVVTLTVSSDAIQRALFPETELIPAEVVPAPCADSDGATIPSEEA